MYITDRFLLLSIVAMGLPMRSISKDSNMAGLRYSIMHKHRRSSDDFPLHQQENRYLEGSTMTGRDATNHRHGPRERHIVEETSSEDDYCNQEFPTIGAVRKWPAFDQASETPYIKNYELRAVGEYIEIWVALDLAFPDPQDCRNILNSTEITDENVNYFANLFDKTIYPIMSNSFSVPPNRDGTNNVSEWAIAFFENFNIPGCSFYGEGSRIVTLIENIRDPDYYDPSSNQYVAGYFSLYINEYTDRNVMTIDAFDWLHRTGANPPDVLLDTSPNDKGCAISFVSEAFGYESAFVHEYSHLLLYYVSYKETWADEGLADYATSVLGYSNTFVDPEDSAFHFSLATFLGFNSYAYGGPEQSLTRWEEEGLREVIGDYGCAYSFFLYLEGQLGAPILKEFRNDPYAQGLEGLQSVIDLNGLNITVQKLMKDWIVALAVAGEITNGALVNGEASDQSHLFAIPSIPLSKINWTNPECYDKPGVPTNGADFVRLTRREGHTYFSAERISSIEFNGAQFYRANPMEWIETNSSALYSGTGDMLDRSLLRQIDVPVTGVISLELAWDIEFGYDFFFVQIYDDAESKWVSLESQNTTYESFDILPPFFPSLPGLTGSSGGEILEQLYQAQEFAGKTVYLALRYCTDTFLSNDGVILYDLMLDDPMEWDATNLSSWQSLTEVFPIPVEWYISLVSYTPGRGSVWAKHLPLDGHHLVINETATLEEYIGSNARIVAALVMAIDVSESIFDFAMYELYVNGILQPGGA